ncbi:MAG: DMT family transporter, partial [Alphaproteobacteria bacterium]|nr:DMT family transporter [Alphaproteobacteria bacterium]
MTVTAAPNIPVKSVPNGALIAWFGVILLAPDALLIRITGLEGMSLLFWRGLLMGGTLMVLWLIFAARRLRQDIRVALSPVGLLLIGVFTVDAITFAIGITMTSATVMLTALATMPIFTVLFSIPMLGEKPSIQTWLTVLFCGIGIVIVVTSGHEAIGAPTGSPIIGGCLGIFTAAGLGFAMVLKRRYPELPTMLSTGTANMMTVGVAWVLLGNAVPVLPAETHQMLALLTMGILVLPMAFFALMVAPRYTSATTVGLIMLTESIMGPLWVWIGTGERPSIMMVAGSIIVISSLSFYFLYANR